MLNIKIFFKYRSGTILITEAITSVFLCILLYLRKCTQLSNLLIKDNKATFFQETKPLLYCTCGLLSVNVHNRRSITNLITFAGGALYRVMYCTLCYTYLICVQNRKFWTKKSRYLWDRFISTKGNFKFLTNWCGSTKISYFASTVQ